MLDTQLHNVIEINYLFCLVFPLRRWFAVSFAYLVTMKVMYCSSAVYCMCTEVKQANTTTKPTKEMEKVMFVQNPSPALNLTWIKIRLSSMNSLGF